MLLYIIKRSMNKLLGSLLRIDIYNKSGWKTKTLKELQTTIRNNAEEINNLKIRNESVKIQISL